PYYQSLNPNPVAAFPSLHAAFPMLGLLALRSLDRRLLWPALAWCLLVWVSIVYLGEHDLVDAVAGVASAALAWAVVTRLVAPRVRALREVPAGAGG
ncbi:MAG: phosphatase PAP2 family protein, partial [Candidatus Dormibacteria bacterium]